MNLHRLLLIGLSALLPLAADTISINPTPVDLSGLPGGTVTFIADLALVVPLDPVFYPQGLNLNALSVTFQNGEFTVDGTPLFLLPPLTNDFPSLAGAALFTIEFRDPNSLAPSLPGLYSGTLIVQGGADFNAADILGSTPFAFTVLSPDASVPEPATGRIFLLGGGLFFALRLLRDAAHWP